MMSITQHVEASAFTALVDPDCADRLREWNAFPAADGDLNLSWQIASSRGAVKDRLLRDENIRVVLIAAASEADPLLRDIARNNQQLPGRAWLHVILVTTAHVTTPLLTQLRHFGSWSVLTEPCNAAEMGEALADAAGKSAEQHRLSMLSAAIRADAEDILIRTRNIVGALCNVEAPAALGNLVRIADRLSGGDTAQDLPPLAHRQQPAGPARNTPSSPSHLLSQEDANRHWTRSLIDLCSARQN